MTKNYISLKDYNLFFKSFCYCYFIMCTCNQLTAEQLLYLYRKTRYGTQGFGQNTKLYKMFSQHRAIFLQILKFLGYNLASQSFNFPCKKAVISSKLAQSLVFIGEVELAEYTSDTIYKHRVVCCIRRSALILKHTQAYFLRKRSIFNKAYNCTHVP